MAAAAGAHHLPPPLPPLPLPACLQPCNAALTLSASPCIYPHQVEDDETPEMIMAKFAELERIQAAAAATKAAQGQAATATHPQAQPEQAAEAAGQQGEQGLPLGGNGGDPQQPAATQQQRAGGSEEGGLTEEQLLEVFKQVGGRAGGNELVGCVGPSIPVIQLLDRCHRHRRRIGKLPFTQLPACLASIATLPLPLPAPADQHVQCADGAGGQ